MTFAALGPEHITLAVIDPLDNQAHVHFAYYTDPLKRQAQTLCDQDFDANTWRHAPETLMFHRESDQPDVKRIPEGIPECPICSEKLPKS